MLPNELKLSRGSAAVYKPYYFCWNTNVYRKFQGFCVCVKSDTKLQQTLKDRLRQENSQEAMLSVADEAGFSFAMSHVLEAGPQLSEKELEGISGGGDAVGGAGIAQNRGV